MIDFKKLYDLLLGSSSVWVPAIGGALSVYLYHIFAKKRKIDELLFNARRESYREFIKEYSKHFVGPQLDLLKTSLFDLGLELEASQSGARAEAGNLSRSISNQKRRLNETEGRIKIEELFANCCLLAGDPLYNKLSKLQRIIRESNFDLSEIPQERRTEYAVTYFQIGIFMRVELQVAGAFDTFLAGYLIPVYAFIRWELPTKLEKIKHKIGK